MNQDSMMQILMGMNRKQRRLLKSKKPNRSNPGAFGKGSARYAMVKGKMITKSEWRALRKNKQKSEV
jgi:hypothetical protein